MPASSATAGGGPGGTKARVRRCWRTHVNSLWSVWYGVLATALQAYITVQAARRFLGFVSLPWPVLAPPPRAEVHLVGALTVAAAAVLPFFLASSLLRVGNLANDGVKLGQELATCSGEPVALVAASHCTSLAPHPLRVLWLHGGPTAPFLHVAAALLLLLPRLCMEARLIQAGFLPRESLWRPDLTDWGLRPDRTLTGDLHQHSMSTLAPAGHDAHAALNATPRAAPPSAMPPRVAPLYLLDKGLRAWAFPAAELQDAESWATVSPELLNYGLALLVYAVRYPAVFWRGNKTFGALFSIQLAANGAQSILALLGASALYKVQVYGVREALPAGLGVAVQRALRQGHGQGHHHHHHQQDAGMLLSPGLTPGLLIATTMLVMASSLVLYLYGYGRLHAFLQTEAAKRVIRVRPRSHGWVCFTHCSALCVLLCACVCEAPLVHDWTILYRGSLDTAVLVTLCACILHLLCWVVLWLLLTVKHKWTFKLRVTVARAVVRSARSVRLCTDVELLSGRRRSAAGGSGGGGAGEASTEPLLVVGNGRAYTVADAEPRNAIMGVINKTQQDRKARLHGNSNGSTAAATGAAGGAAATAGSSGVPSAAPSMEPISQPGTGVYWLRPGASEEAVGVAWMGRKAAKPKVTFDDSATKRENGVAVVDDGDYALLQELPLVAQMPASSQLHGACPASNAAAAGNGNLSAPGSHQHNQQGVQQGVQGHHPPERGQAGQTRGDYEDPSPLLTPEPLTTASDVDEAPLPDLDDLPPPPPNVTSAPPGPGSAASVSDRSEASSSGGSGSGSGGDSSGCATASASGSPPGLSHRGTSSDHSSHSDTSGVHSSSSHSASGAQPTQPAQPAQTKLYEQLKYEPQQMHLQQQYQYQYQYQQQQQQARRANSVADLCLEPARVAPPQYKSFSLTRGMAPPASSAGGVPSAMAPPAPVPTVLKLQSQPIYSSIRKPSQGVTLKPPQPALDDDDESPPPPAPPEPMSLQHRLGSHGLSPLIKTLQPVREVAENGGSGGVPATLQLNGHDDTVVIRRHKQTASSKDGEEDKFGRATNMRMTSFTDQPDYGRTSLGSSGYGYGLGFGAGSASTLPLPPPPPPPPAAQQHCATLPAHGASAMLQQQQQQHQQQQQLASSCSNFIRQHSTIPTHHNGVMLYQPGQPSSMTMRGSAPLGAGAGMGAAMGAGINMPCFKDHSMSPSLKYGLQQHLQQHLRAGVGVGGDIHNATRDSANFSMASSGDGEFAH